LSDDLQLEIADERSVNLRRWRSVGKTFKKVAQILLILLLLFGNTTDYIKGE